MKTCSKIFLLLLSIAGVSQTALSEVKCYASFHHPESGEGELWSIDATDGEDVKARRSMIFYYHNVPFSLDGVVDEFSLHRDKGLAMSPLLGTSASTDIRIKILFMDQSTANIWLNETRLIVAELAVRCPGGLD